MPYVLFNFLSANNAVCYYTTGMKSAQKSKQEPVSTLSLDQVKSQIDTLLNQFIKEQTKVATFQSPEYARLWKVIHSVSDRGGKRLRPYLLLSSYRAFGGKTDISHVALAHELLHISMLMHDDIIDRDTTRHGADNVIGHYQKIYADIGSQSDIGHYANAASLLAGDLLISSAYSLIAKSDLDSEQKMNAILILHDSVFTVVGGELNDVESSWMPVELVDPLHVAHYKTAIYSCVNPIRTGATLAGAQDHELKLLETFGVNLGIAFQLTDDLLGVFGDSQKTGKSTISDLAEGKRTFLVTQTLQNLPETKRAQFNRYFGKHNLNERQADELRHLIIESGAQLATRACVSEHILKAERALTELEQSVGPMNTLRTLLQKIGQREN